MATLLQYEQADGAVACLCDLLARRYEEERVYATLLTVFSFLALGVAGVGPLCHDVVLGHAPLRADGATAGRGVSAADVVLLVMRRGVGQAVLGGAIGLLAAGVAAGTLSDLLFEIAPRDPAT